MIKIVTLPFIELVGGALARLAVCRSKQIMASCVVLLIMAVMAEMFILTHGQGKELNS